MVRIIHNKDGSNLMKFQSTEIISLSHTDSDHDVTTFNYYEKNDLNRNCNEMAVLIEM